jgi:hypothetical protein
MGGVVVETKHYLADVASHAGIAGTEVVVDSDHFVVSALKQIVGEVAEPMVCMSTHGHSGLLHAMLGSSAEDAIRELGVPMLLVGPNVELPLASRFDSVVVCTDGTSTSRAIVPEVSAWIRSLRLRAWVVQVLDPETRRALEAAGEEPAVKVGAVPCSGGVVADAGWRRRQLGRAALRSHRARDCRPRPSSGGVLDRDGDTWANRSREARARQCHVGGRA